MVKPDPQEQIENILKLTDRLFKQLLPTVPRELLELDVTMPQLKIMFLLYVNGHMRMSDLAADLDVTLATATGLVDRLVEKEMVTRENLPEDRRVVLCRLSATGESSVSRLWYSAKDRMRGLLRAIDGKRLNMLAEVLETMLASAERMKEERTNVQ